MTQHSKDCRKIELVAAFLNAFLGLMTTRVDVRVGACDEEMMVFVIGVAVTITGTGVVVVVDDGVDVDDYVDRLDVVLSSLSSMKGVGVVEDQAEANSSSSRLGTCLALGLVGLTSST